ncbi:hypothetical protein FJR38_03910 [Anabaena sp. UHCC 0253]|uniref:hypothetical protein n=1 Tax=Anabaena sp. UHCC 0253 TaxID=2590019 RepID=UPI001447548E|nr:hypothetical protein [Anabaena sp. UHCC 0253]MTJ51877.1 hypothetical protein [Anabaena sp. UHCC 0253]
MKCINCGTDNNLKDRTANQGRCKQCNHPFAFEPTSMGNVKITDPMFAKILADISASNTLFFTPKQLLYFLDSRLRNKSFQSLQFASFYIFMNVWFTGFVGGFLSGIIGNNSFLIANLIYQVCVVIYLFKNTTSAKLNNPGRKASAKSLQRLGVLILVVGILASLFVFKSFILFVAIVIIGTSSLFLGTQQLGKIGKLTQELLISPTQLQDWLNRWEQINNAPEKILLSPRKEITPALVNPDVTAYSFDRLVVCDSSTTAQLLIANNFHFENNCAILSITGYPESIFNTTMEMLHRNPDLKVYAIHDCSSKGISLVNHIRSSDRWFLNSNVTIIDIGLLPRQIMATKRGMFIQSSPDLATTAKQLSEEVRQSLTSEELAWLDAGNFVELESFTPQRLIQILRSAIISASYNFAIDNSSMILIGDSGNDIYMVESFG